MNNVPSSERTHIGFFGLRNSGKSSLVNAITSQNLSLVSDIKGTTTDPVYKTMELLPLGPVVIIDTPGIDDEGTLGRMRVEKAYETIDKIHIAILTVDISNGLTIFENNLISEFKSKNIPYIIAYTKKDLYLDINIISDANSIIVSSKTGYNINELKEKIAHLINLTIEPKYIIKDFISKGDYIIMVVPIDESAPKGRLILPQQLTLREILDCQATAIVCQHTELAQTLQNLNKKPKIVITDSQVFDYVKEIVPSDIKLTSFSILMMNYKCLLNTALSGCKYLDTLSNGNHILISEGCTHHRQCKDIGTVKLPALINKYTGKELNYSFTSGRDFPSDLRKYSLVIHCGGCMLNENEMLSRSKKCIRQGIPFTNYGCIISKINGILERTTEFFK